MAKIVGYKVTVRVLSEFYVAEDHVIHVGTDKGFGDAVVLATGNFKQGVYIDRCIVDRQEEAPNG